MISKMEAQLCETYYGVYNSSKEILKNNQRHLFCNMLDLLANTCKTTALVNSKIASDEMLQFWFNDILPLMFDTDADVQAKALDAFEYGSTLIDIDKLHENEQWPAFKTRIMNEHLTEIQKLCEQYNSNWHRIWCYIIRLIDRDLFKGAQTINSFLSIVETGFRSSNETVRTVSYRCWRVLIEIFHKHKQLTIPKRLKLICIPLKSAQAKTVEAAEIKLRVWWYLLTCLSDRLDEHFKSVIEPFITFCFGGNIETKRISSAVEHFPSVQNLAMVCLNKLLMIEPDECIEKDLADYQLEKLFDNTSLCLADIVHSKHLQILVSTGIRAISLLPNNVKNLKANDLVNKQQQLQQLLKQLMLFVLKKDDVELNKSILLAFLTIPDVNTKVFSEMMNTLANRKIVFHQTINNLDSNVKILNLFVQLFARTRPIVSANVLHSCVQHVFGQVFEVGVNHLWRLVDLILQEIYKLENLEENLNIFITKLQCWQQDSLALLKYLKQNPLDTRLKENFLLMAKWLIWPLRMHLNLLNKQQNSTTSPCRYFDTKFCAIWHQLLNSMQNSNDFSQLLKEINEILKEFLESAHLEQETFVDLLSSYTVAIQQTDELQRHEHYKAFFHLMQEILKQSLTKKCMESCLTYLRQLILKFTSDDINEMFGNIKDTIILVARLCNRGSNKNAVESKYFDEFKRSILDKMRSHPRKELVSELKDIFKNNDVFVVIPSVWSLKPEKLTEHQKERMAEKTILPALYNDLSRSQSQETSIQAWTPKKIVIQNSDDSDIVLLPSSANGKKAKSFSNSKTNKNSGDAEENQSRKVGEKYNTRYSRRRMSISSENILNKSVSDKADNNSDNNESSSKQSNSGGGQRIQTDEKKEIESPQKSEKEIQMKETQNKTIDILKENNEGVCSSTETPVAIGHTDSSELSQSLHKLLDIPTNSEGLETQLSVTTEELNLSIHENECRQNIQEINDEEESFSLEKNFDANISTQQLNDSNKSLALTFANESKSQDNENETTVLTLTEALQMKELSPKKSSLNAKANLLASPPNRRLISNSTSPTLRPKLSSHLTGRGAQLINMIRNRNAEANSSHLQNSGSETPTQTRAAGLSQSRPTPTELIDLSATDNTSTPIAPIKELLIFSKHLPSLTASPSASILKRKHRILGTEDMESPISKRKRVSFHDPPVSVTKEYLRDSDIKPRRCLILDKQYNLDGKRITHEQQQFGPTTRSKIREDLTGVEKDTNSSISEGNKDSAMNANANKKAAEFAEKLAKEMSYEKLNLLKSQEIYMENTTSSASTHLQFSIDDALTMVLEQCSLNTILEKYFTKENPSQNKSMNVLIKFISNAMLTQPKLKTTVLETLSENHSKDFLDHAVQENLSSVVCDRLNLNSVIDYVCAKSKINTICRTNLLQQLPNLLKNSKCDDNERLKFIENLLKRMNFSDKNILDVITILMNLRSEQSLKGETDNPALLNIAESAADSSSNL